MPSGIRVVSVVDAIADNLRDAILDGDLLPGTALTETDVATRFDVARPTATGRDNAVCALHLIQQRHL
jgi:DNA-binding GntR family transcriptional regulator